MVLYKEDWYPDAHENETAAFSVRAVDMATAVAESVLNECALKNLDFFPGVVWARIGVVNTKSSLRIAVVEVQKPMDSNQNIIGLINCYRYRQVDEGGQTVEAVCKSLRLEKIMFENK